MKNEIFYSLFKIIKIQLVVFLIFNFLYLNKSFSNEKPICDSDVIQHIYENIKNTNEIVFNYHENRNDIGVFYDFTWNKKIKKIVTKRNNENYPIVRFSLFEKNKIIPNKTAVKYYNNIDLSKASDQKIEFLHKQSDNAILTLYNGEKINLNFRPYKLNDFKLSNFNIKSINNIDTTKGILELSFDANITNNRNDLIKYIDLNKYNFEIYEEICLQVRKQLNWPAETVELDEFKYDADVREGLKNKEILIKSVFDLSYDNNEIRTIRTEGGVASFRQSFDFKKFPFDKQNLIITIKSGVGSYENENLQNYNEEGSVTFITPESGPFLNLIKFQNPINNKLKAWKIYKVDIISRVIDDKNYYDKFNKEIIDRSENVLDIKISLQRNYQHYLLKIMLPVFLILCVAWFVLWIPTEKYEARLNTSIIALLALIAYNFVFQDDIPKLEYLTDLDWFILLSYIFCCIPVFLSIAFSKFISRNQRKVKKINRYIKLWGVVIYFLINGFIFN
tara:strand:+ start:531 stop:2045 length:1515 start_codon:yes stop_codon:yes gene_type:complete